MLETVLHEFSHAIVGLLMCTKVKCIKIKTDKSGVTKFGLKDEKFHTIPDILVSSAGYTGSSLIGSVFVFCGFNIVASKGATIGIGAVFLLTIYWARKDWVSWVICLAASGLIVGCWFIDHARPLRYFMLLVGTMVALSAVWSSFLVVNGSIPQGSDAHDVSEAVGGNPKCWAACWCLIGLMGLAAAVLMGLMVFKQTDEEMWAASGNFLPTKM